MEPIDDPRDLATITDETGERRNPEWSPWGAVVEAVLDGIQDPAWDALVPERLPHKQPGTPLLAEVEMRLDDRAQQLLSDLQRRVAYSGARHISTLDAVRDEEISGTFHAALNGTSDPMHRVALQSGDSDAFMAIAGLLPFPFLHACARRWADSISTGWTEGYCPVCGAWPACAEDCGVERTRYLRCGRCGSGWQLQDPCCLYCGKTGHEKFAALNPEKNGTPILIEVCNHCKGYVKIFVTSRPGTPVGVMLEDLGSSRVDFAALSQGYQRPSGLGHSLDVTLRQE